MHGDLPFSKPLVDVQRGAPVEPLSLEFDVLLICDLTRRSDLGMRIKQEIETYNDMGLRVGLLHLPVHNAGTPISPDLGACLRLGMATPLAVDAPATAKLAIVYSATQLTDSLRHFLNIRADRVVLVIDRKPDVKQMGTWFSFDFAPVTWAPTNRWIRSALIDLKFPVPVEEEDWRTIARPVPSIRIRRGEGLRKVIGRVSALGPAQWSSSQKEFASLYPAQNDFEYRVLGEVPNQLRSAMKPASKWTTLKFGDISVERFVEMLDIFMYFPGAIAPELPEAAISAAMASGKIVVLPPRLKPHFGPGALYSEPSTAIAAISELLEDEDAANELRATAVREVEFQFSEERHRQKVMNLAGLKQKKKPKKSKNIARRPQALMIPSNGVGVGHVTRLLAIARRLDHHVEPVFATLAQASDVIDSFGYLPEYLPSHSDIGGSFAAWDAWFRYELSDILARHQIDVLVYDGNNPSPGLISAALSNGRCRLVWVRRAMWGETPSPYLDNARFFDAIIEPGEIAEERDTGGTVDRREETIPVAPIRLLESAELLSREDARGALGLSGDKPAVLLQLGSGAKRDLLKLIDRIVAELKPFPDLQIVIAEWSNGQFSLPHWPNTQILRGYPLSRYFNAFDFSIAAAGYNTFHEVMGFGLPTIFVAERHPSMDVQSARSEFAQDHGAGFDLTEDKLFHLPALCEALMNEKANGLVRQRCLELDRGNGAGDAALLIAKMIGVDL